MVLKKIRQLLKDQNGTAAIEMGLVLPLFIAVLFPPIEYARYQYANRILIESVEDGAKFASLNLTDPDGSVTEDDVRDLIIAQAGGYAPKRSDIKITYAPRKEQGARVTIVASAGFNELVDVFGDITHRVGSTRTMF